jgi:predicted metal-dependent RNase
VPCHQKFARVILKIFYDSRYAVAVYVHVERRHENRNLNAFVFEKFLFTGSFYHHYFAVGRGNHMMWVYDRMSGWVTEKLKNEQKEKT